MKTQLFAFLSLACLATFAAPHFVTPEMIQRNGLTDEQYEKLWKLGKHPRIDIATARDWVFRGSRYQNVTNWLGVIGKTNDFARLVIPTMATNEVLVATNKHLNVSLTFEKKRRIKFQTAYTNEVRVASEWKQTAEERKEDAEYAKRIRKANKKANKVLTKFKADLEKGLKKASTDEEREFYEAWLALINSEVNQ